MDGDKDLRTCQVAGASTLVLCHLPVTPCNAFLAQVQNGQKGRNRIFARTIQTVVQRGFPEPPEVFTNQKPTFRMRT